MRAIILSFLAVALALAHAETGKSKASSTVQDVVNLCYSYLESHLCEGSKWGKPYHFYRPSLDKYSPDQWLWDSGAHMITWSHKNVSNSILDMRTMLQFQQQDGRIPEQIYWGPRDAKGDAAILAQYSNTQFTDITQMPVLPYSLRAIYNATHDKAVLKEFLYPLVDYFQWWRNTRDFGDGLVVVIHNWESGLDGSPAYDPAFHVYVTELNQTSFSWLYPKFDQLIAMYRYYYDWDMTEILGRKRAPKFPSPETVDSWFMMKDLAVNSVYASGWRILGELAQELEDANTAEYCFDQSKVSSEAIFTKMWIPSQGQFNSLFIDWDGKEKTSIANTVQNLFPLLLKDLPEDKKNFLTNQLKDPKKYNSPFSVPTVSMDDPQFSASFGVDLMWRGPVWGFTNWFILEGLGLHGEFKVQATIVNKWVELAKLSGIWEQYNPFTGEGYGPEGLGMSTLVCDYIYRYGMV
jgi:hypothetical protein